MTFVVNQRPLQRGRGLGGLLSNVLKKIIPYGKSFIKGGVKIGKDFLNSDEAKSMIKDTVSTAASAATSALVDKDTEAAKQEIVKSLKRSKSKSSDYAKRLARSKLEKVLIGKGKEKRRKTFKKLTKFKSKSLLDD